MTGFRPARPGDLDAILATVAQARAAIARLGIDQWQDGYPEREVIEADIAQGIGWVFEAEGQVAGYLALAPSPEPVYETIDGKWLTDGEYLTVHRSCAGDAARGRGLGAAMLAFAEAQARMRGLASVRADTHRGNVIMRHLLEKSGFAYCGEVSYPVTAGDPLRAAYEKLVTDS